MSSDPHEFLGVLLSGLVMLVVGSLSILGKRITKPHDYRTPGLPYSELFKAQQWRGIVAVAKVGLVVGSVLVVVGLSGLLLGHG